MTLIVVTGKVRHRLLINTYEESEKRQQKESKIFIEKEDAWKCEKAFEKKKTE